MYVLWTVTPRQERYKRVEQHSCINARELLNENIEYTIAVKMLCSRNR